jgi:transportin-1
MSPYIERLYVNLLAIIQSNVVPASVTENAAVALGRLGLGSCDDLAPHLDTFAYPFLDALDKVAETDEKDTALKGFCMVVGRNPEAMESCLVPFFRTIARYKMPTSELKDLFRQVCSFFCNDRVENTDRAVDCWWIPFLHRGLQCLPEPAAAERPCGDPGAL